MGRAQHFSRTRLKNRTLSVPNTFKCSSKSALAQSRLDQLVSLCSRKQFIIEECKNIVLLIGFNSTQYIELPQCAIAEFA